MRVEAVFKVLGHNMAERQACENAYKKDHHNKVHCIVLLFLAKAFSKATHTSATITAST